MTVVLRVEGLRVVVHGNDHVPAQVHVLGDGEAKVSLMSAGMRPSWSRLRTRAEIRRAMRVMSGQQAFLPRRWEQLHD